MQQKNITRLPLDHLRTISSFLSSSDAIQFSNTCRLIHRDLSLGLLDGTTIEELHEHNADDIFHLWTEIPIPFEEKGHSVHFEAIWRDQSWGNRKGEVAITSSVEKRPFEFIARSGIAEHHETPLRLTFKVEPGKKYHLMYKVGGGGGHSLHVHHVKRKYLIHGAGLARMCNGISQGNDLQIALVEATANSFEMSMMNGDSPDRHLALAMLNQFGITKVDRETIDNLRDLARFLKEGKDVKRKLESLNQGLVDSSDSPDTESSDSD